MALSKRSLICARNPKDTYPNKKYNFTSVYVKARFSIHQQNYFENVQACFKSVDLYIWKMATHFKGQNYIWRPTYSDHNVSSATHLLRNTVLNSRWKRVLQPGIKLQKCPLLNVQCYSKNKLGPDCLLNWNLDQSNSWFRYFNLLPKGLKTVFFRINTRTSDQTLIG